MTMIWASSTARSSTLRDVITFQGRSVDDLPEALERAVDDYLKFCEERGREPDKPFSGKVALRMDPETHRVIVGAARTSGKSLNTWILDAISNEMHRPDARTDDFGWTVEETALEAFQAFLQEISLHRRNQEAGEPRYPHVVRSFRREHMDQRRTPSP